MTSSPVLFSLAPHPMQAGLIAALIAEAGVVNRRQFPDGESYLRIDTPVQGRACIVLADLSDPDPTFLPLLFLANTLRELGAASVILIAPYLAYMRQDRRFVEGEAVTSKIFAAEISRCCDALATVDPHLHRYHSLDEIYTIPSRVVQGAPALAAWLKDQQRILLVGPDEESEQWVSKMAAVGGHPFVVGRKQRFGDRDVKVTLPDLSAYKGYTAVMVDDVISSGQTLLKCADALKAAGIREIHCAAVHGIFADESDKALTGCGVKQIITTNTIPHASNRIDMSGLVAAAVRPFLKR